MDSARSDGRFGYCPDPTPRGKPSMRSTPSSRNASWCGLDCQRPWPNRSECSCLMAGPTAATSPGTGTIQNAALKASTTAIDRLRGAENAGVNQVEYQFASTSGSHDRLTQPAPRKQMSPSFSSALHTCGKRKSGPGELSCIATGESRCLAL